MSRSWTNSLNFNGYHVKQLMAVAVLTLGYVSVGQASPGQHGCALTAGGGVKCWGYNAYGQLGDGTTTDRLTPVGVVGLSSGVVQISTGDLHTCALTAAGGVKCWGFNSYGELGDGTTSFRTLPVNVSGLTSGVAQLIAGYYHTCAVTTSLGAKCWGYNGYGGLGDGSTADRLTPVNVTGLTSGVTQISPGFIHTCAVTTGGGAKCWGYNGAGGLGDGTLVDRLTAVDVSGLTGVAEISAGDYHTCAVVAGAAKCWGYNAYGQLGDGTFVSQNTPVTVSGLGSGVLQIKSGEYHDCALTSVGGTKCWGRNLYGQLGDGTTTVRTTPVDVTGLTSGVIALPDTGVTIPSVISLLQQLQTNNLFGMIATLQGAQQGFNLGSSIVSGNATLNGFKIQVAAYTGTLLTPAQAAALTQYANLLIRPPV